MRNRDAWLHGAADAYYQRNKTTFGKQDLVIPLLAHLGFRGAPTLEVGCADGWRLRQIHDVWKCDVAGIDPSWDALHAARRLKIPKATFVEGTADDLSAFKDEAFQLVILGFVMWFIEPELWFKVAAETDRVLADGGMLVIYDYVTARPFRINNWNTEASMQEQQTHAWCNDFPKLWLGHPWYRIICENMNFKALGKLMLAEGATALMKDKKTIFGTELG